MAPTQLTLRNRPSARNNVVSGRTRSSSFKPCLIFEHVWSKGVPPFSLAMRIYEILSLNNKGILVVIDFAAGVPDVVHVRRSAQKYLGTCLGTRGSMIPHARPLYRSTSASALSLTISVVESTLCALAVSPSCPPYAVKTGRLRALLAAIHMPAVAITAYLKALSASRTTETYERNQHAQGKYPNRRRQHCTKGRNPRYILVGSLTACSFQGSHPKRVGRSGPDPHSSNI
jgi:hypothetical protein